jgi:DNA polymerase-3 subunit beta
MEFKIKRNTLAKTLGNVVKIIPPKSTYTILQNIIIEAKGKNLLIQATDLDVFVKKVIPAEVKEEGRVLIPGKKLLEITRESSIDDIAFKLQELKLHIVAGNAKFSIPSLDYQEFPEVPQFPEKKWFDLTVAEAQTMVESTIFMVAKDMSRRPMNGILLQMKDDELRVVATDGARLAMHTLEKQAPKEEIILATKVFELIDVDDPEEKVELFAEERMMGIKFADTTVIARLIEGPYPNYEGVIPKTFVGNCTIERDVFEGALKRVALVASPHIKNVKFDFNENKIRLSASSPDIGEAQEQVSCLYDGEPLGVWFNANYVLEILRHISTADVTLQLTSTSTAALVKPKDVGNLTYLLMPLRIDSWE